MMLLGIGIILLTFLAMEFVAWFTHKYVMHGLLWYFHKDHHQPHPGFFEKNDFFFLIFAIPGSLSIFFGLSHPIWWLTYIGVGITVYGACYFLVHDVFIHQRFKWFRNARSSYFAAIRKAHKVHHKHLGKEDGECFGMLIVPYKYFREAKKFRRNLS